MSRKNFEYLAVQTSTGSGVHIRLKYRNTVPGWDMSEGDTFYVSDHNNDKADDIIVYNPTSWKTEHLGVLTTQNLARLRLRGNHQKDWIGKWNLRKNDKILVANTRKNSAGLIIYNDRWLGNLSATEGAYEQLSIHPDYIKDYPYHKNGWW
jgi:hypothetical protein